MGEQKYYVVWKGKKPGVYDSWQKCQEEIKNIKGARFKSFDDVKKADNAYSIGYDEYKKTNPIINEGDGPNLDSISVDAASSGNPGKMEYRGVDTKTKKVLFKIGTLYSPLKIFFPLSVLCFTTGLVHYIYTYLSAGRFTNMSMLLFFTSLLIFLIGLVSEQITMLLYQKLKDK